MDGDDFSRVTRLGRAVAEGIIDAATGDAPFDGFATALLIDRFIEASNGIACLPGMLEILADLGSAPLLLPTRIDEAKERIGSAAHGPECGMLDLQLGLAVKSAILRGQTDPEAILERFICKLIERHVIMCRGGLVDPRRQRGSPPGSWRVDICGLQYVQHARELTAPIARDAAAELVRRPDAKQLRLSLKYRITETSNLLGAA